MILAIIIMVYHSMATSEHTLDYFVALFEDVCDSSVNNGSVIKIG